MEWLNSIYSDGTKEYVSNPIPKLGEKIKIQLRMFEKAPVSCIFLRYKKDGLEYLEEMKETVSENGLQYYECEVKVESRTFSYHFYVVSEQKIFYYNQKGVFEEVQDEIYDFKILAGYEQADWIKGRVFYQIFPDRFCKGQEAWRVRDEEYIFSGYQVQAVENWDSVPEEFSEAHCLDFYGGDLQGIEKKIPYLQELGVNGIYLNPIFSAATVHKYDCIDYFHVDKHLGGDQMFKNLMQALHEKDIRLILDISINHTGSGHQWFNAEGYYVKEQGAYVNVEAKERAYYYFDNDGSYGCYANLPVLPKLNYHSEELRGILYKNEASVLKKWLKEPYNIDGWRFDVAATTGQYKLDHFEHEIWPEIRSAIKDTKSDAYILAEDWNDGYEFLQGSEWDGIMNFFGCGRPVRDYVGQLDFRHGRNEKLGHTLPNASGKALAERICGFFGKLPYVIQETQFNMFDCHDIGRLHNYSEISFSQYKMAVYLMYMLPGAVCIYYGDEIGLDGRVGSTEGCRYPMNWKENYKENKYFHLYQCMNLERKQSKALKYGGFKILVAKDKVFACARFTKEEVYIVVTSMEQEKIEKVILDLKLFGDCFRMPEKDRIGEELKYSIREDGKVVLEVPACRGFFIKLEKG